ncbi:unnamed protein product [Parajaminaea phylloscopi]
MANQSHAFETRSWPRFRQQRSQEVPIRGTWATLSQLQRSSNAPLPKQDFDPLSAVTRPPANETPQQRAKRMEEDQRALSRTHQIDRLLREDGQRQRRERRGERKVLLLGQSEAGKTTILKQMRMLYAPLSHAAERQAWGVVVQINLIQAVELLLEAYEAYLIAKQTIIAVREDLVPRDGGPLALPTQILQLRLLFSPLFSTLPTLRRWLGAVDVGGDRPVRSNAFASPASAPSRREDRTLIVRNDWQTRLVAAANRRAALFDDAHGLAITETKHGPERQDKSGNRDLRRSVAPSSSAASTASPWRSRPRSLDSSKAWQPFPSPVRSTGTTTEVRRYMPPDISPELQPQEVTKLLVALTDDILILWNQPFARDIRSRGQFGFPVVDESDKRRNSTASLMSIISGSVYGAPGTNAVGSSSTTSKIHPLEGPLGGSSTGIDIKTLRSASAARARSGDYAFDSPLYFLNNVSRIASLTYVPSDEDILHARLRTVAVHEELFLVRPPSTKFRVFDFGGTRALRASWPWSFFEDAAAILFVVAVSAFDETLEEDSQTNRISDSLNLYRQVLRSKLLANVHIVLLLNKVDLLKKKIGAGIPLAPHLPGYHLHRQFYTRKRPPGRDMDAMVSPESSGPSRSVASASLRFEYECALSYFVRKFREVAAEDRCRAVAPHRSIYIHTTVATSSRQIRPVLKDVHDAIVRDNLRDIGLT